MDLYAKHDFQWRWMRMEICRVRLMAAFMISSQFKDGATPQDANSRSQTFQQMQDLSNVVFRIPTPTFGLGLVENISEATIVNNAAANAAAAQALGISGHVNRSGNDGTITRFGWKAQNKSLLIFAGEAYNVEAGSLQRGIRK